MTKWLSLTAAGLALALGGCAETDQASDKAKSGTGRELVRQACGDKALAVYERESRGQGAVRKLAIARRIADDCRAGRPIQ